MKELGWNPFIPGPPGYKYEESELERLVKIVRLHVIFVKFAALPTVLSAPF